MNPEILKSLLRVFLKQRKVAQMSDEKVRRFAYAISEKTGLNFRPTLIIICELVERKAPDPIYAFDFVKEMQEILQRRRQRVPRWNYGPGGNHILVRLDRRELFVENDRCTYGGKSFPTPRATIDYILR